MFRKSALPILVLLVMLSVSLVFAPSSSADDLEYDPKIHVYEEGMGTGVMKDHVKYGTLKSLNDQIGQSSKTDQPNVSPDQKSEDEIIVPIFQGGITPNAVEAGSWFYPRAWPWQSGDAQYASNVRWYSCSAGYDDAYVDYYYVPESKLWGNKLRVWATNVVSSAHIVQNGGLDGGYYCVGGYCTISVCSTQVPGANPWSVYLFHLY